MEFVITQDGSPTIYDSHYKEHHHSLIGAYTEARYKFAEVAKRLLPEKQKIDLLDLPFGLGYNLIATLDAFPTSLINCTAIELDQSVINSLSICPFPEQLKKKFLKLLPLAQMSQIAQNSKKIQESNFSLELIVGDLLDELPKLAQNNSCKYDLIFYDSFSPRSAPAMWSRDKVLKYFFHLLKDEGLLITYTASNKVRKGLIEAGFEIAPSVSVGRKMPGTIAFKEVFKSTFNFLDLENFTEETLQKIDKSMSY